MENIIYYKLNEIGNSYFGLTGKTKDDFYHGTSFFVTYMNVFKDNIKRDTLSLIDIKSDEKQNKVKKGDIFFTVSSETIDEVGMCLTIDFDMDNLYLNSFCFGYRLKNKNISSDYLCYLLKSKNMRKKIINLGQ